MRRLLIALLSLALLTACTPPEVGIGPVIEVTGEFGRRPQIAFDPPQQIMEQETRIITQGQGKELQEADPILLEFVAVSAATGETLEDTYSGAPRSLTLTEDAGPLYEELLGKREGTRLLHLSQGTVSRPEPVVMVYDILYTRARGEETGVLEGQEDLPSVHLDDDGRPHVSVPDAADPPSQLKVLTLIKGEGPQVTEGGLITAHYTSAAWDGGGEFDSTWGEKLAPPAIPFTGLIPAWQEGLAGATVGSQIMIIAPPEAAFGSDTVVFVIDLLARTKPEGNSDE